MTQGLFRVVTLGILFSAATGESPAAAQGGMLGRLKQQAKQQIEGIKGAAPAPAAAAPAAEPEAEAGAAPGGSADAASARPGEGAWVNYDYVPGNRPLFVDDFGRDRVGDFPQRLEFIEGNMEVAEWQGRRWLRATSTGKFAVPLAETLPERFTLEFDYAGLNKYELKVRFHGPEWQDEEEVHVGAWGWGVSGSSVKAISKPKDAEDIENRVVRVRVMADGRYVKVYVDGERVANVPNADLGRADKIWFEVPGWEQAIGLVGDVQVMAGGRDLYDALAENGRVATQGILFDTGSDRVRPESTPTLKEIAQALQDHPELRIRIEGHTDNVGQAAANQALSDKRAAAVKQMLVDAYGIDAARLESQGFGASKPTTGNETAEGRQQNRRVELVKL